MVKLEVPNQITTMYISKDIYPRVAKTQTVSAVDRRATRHRYSQSLQFQTRFIRVGRPENWERKSFPLLRIGASSGRVIYAGST